jgi:hypothetical protein
MADIPERLTRLEGEIIHQKEMVKERFNRLEEKVDRNFLDSTEARESLKTELRTVVVQVEELKELIAMAKGVKLFLTIIGALLGLLAALGLKDLTMRFFVRT